MDAGPQRKPNFAPEIAVGIGYALFFMLFVAACMVMFVTLARSVPAAAEAAPTHAALVTPTARLSATPRPDEPGVFLDDFGTNENQWGTHWWDTKQSHLRDGKLILENKEEDSSALVACGTCLDPIRPYYLQADLSTDAATDESFGIMIRTRYSAREFYLYQITTESHEYCLWHYGDKGWTMRACGLSDLIRSFPAVNTLGIYVNGSQLEFYVNGQAVDTYVESGIAFESGLVGFYAEGTGYQLEIDNLLIKGIGQ